MRPLALAPKLVEIIDRKTRERVWIRIDGPMPSLVNPPEPRISQDTGPENPAEDEKRKERPN